MTKSKKKPTNSSNLFESNTALLGTGLIGSILLLGTIWYSIPLNLNTSQSKNNITFELQTHKPVEASFQQDSPTYEEEYIMEDFYPHTLEELYSDTLTE